MPGFLSTGVLAALMTLVSKVWACADLRTRVCVPGAHCSDSDGLGQREIEQQHHSGMMVL